MTEQATLTDYQAIGGGPAVKEVVDDFYSGCCTTRS
jgi:truncated hemoglobin YjbI